MRKKLRGKLPLTVCAVIALIAAAIFAARLADWQLIHGDEYKQLSTRSTSYSKETAATRGEILDKDGNGLVTNTTHYKIVIDKLYADENKLNATILSLVDLLGKAGDGWDDALPVSFSDGGFSFKQDASEDDLKQLREISEAGKDAPAEHIISLLCGKYDIPGDFSDEQKRVLCSVRYNMELTDYSNSNPYTFASDVSRDAVSAVSENTQGVGGIDVETYLVREAQDPTLAPHLIGALGAVTEEEYEQLSYSGKHYEITDTVGKFGIESAFEDELKGEGGTKIIQRNSDGTIVDTVETINSKPGNTVYLTLDSKLQKIAGESLKRNIEDARAEGEEESEEKGEKLRGEDCNSGAVVMLDVSDFSVLAAASYPTYDLNKYSKYDDYYVSLAENKTSPLYNRAFSGTFEWGSVFKPCVALAALEENIITPETEIFCTEKYDYYPSSVVKCMHRHEDIDLRGAITNTVQAAIGQSDNAFTPVQLATYAATVANDGVRLKTHVVSKITDYERKKVIADYSKPEKVLECGVSKENLEIVQSDMLNVTQDEDGTGYLVFGDYPIEVAAKTGTAENSGSDHTTFICYAPYDKPKVAVAVVLEHGVKGKYSMQVARDLLDGYFRS